MSYEFDIERMSPFTGKELSPELWLNRPKRVLAFKIDNNLNREKMETQRVADLAKKRYVGMKQSLEDADFLMEEQLYRYNGMLIGPHDLLRAAKQFRIVRSRFIQSQRDAFVSKLQAHFIQAIPTNFDLVSRTKINSENIEVDH